MAEVTGAQPINYGDDAEYQKKLREMLMQRMQQQERGLEAESKLGREGASADSASARSIALMNAMNKGASQFGSIGGKVADTSASDDFTKNLLGIQQQNIGDIRSSRQDRDKLNQYLMGKLLDQEGKVAEGRTAAMKSAQDQARYDKEFGLKKKELDIKEAGVEKKGTKAQEAVDRNFAKTYEDWTVSGGYADFEKGLGQIENAISELEKDPGLTGPVVGRTPDAVLSVAKPNALAIRDQVQDVVQRNLRAVLGAQFTEQEGKRLIERAYNPTLSAEENISRLRSLVKQMRGAAAAKESAARYYEEKGTLAGFKGKSPSSMDFGSETSIAEAPKSGQAIASPAQVLPPNKIRVSNGQETVIIDRSDMVEALKDGYREVK